MSTDLFRASIKDKSIGKTLVNIQVQHKLEQLPILNLLQSDQSLLTTSQWTLLSNLCNGYNESKLFSLGQRLIDTHDVNANYQTLVQEFIASIYETTGTYLRSNDDFYKLSSDDRSIMIHNAADNVSCISGVFIIHHFHLLDLDEFLNVMIRMYGNRSEDIHFWAIRFIDPDIVLIKLAFALFAFSENTYLYTSNISEVLTNPINILEIQNKYAEITWKYLLYRYGHYQAVKRFLNLIIWIQASTIFMSHIQTLTLHVNDVNALAERIELTLILDDVDQMLEKD